MISSVGLEVMNSTNPELNWKPVTKGRRSRKSVARSLNSVAKVGNSTSPKRVGDFSGSDSDKFGEVVPGQSTSGKSENVPLKKRRHLLQSPPLHPWSSSLHRQDSTSPRTRSSSPLSEDHEHLQYTSCSSGQRSSNWTLRGIERSAKVRGGDGFDNIFLCDQTESEYNDGGDFSGIELLAEAASMDDDADNADKKMDSSMPKNSDASGSATLPKLGLKNEPEKSSSNMNVHEGRMDCSQVNNSAAASKSLCGSPEEGTVPKVNRQHWDLNTLMDAWDEPFDDCDGDISKDVNDYMHLERRQKDSRDHVHSEPGAIRDESFNLKIEDNKSRSVSEDRICSEPPSLEEHSQEPPMSIYSNAVRETSDQAGEKDPDRNSIQVLNCDTDMKKSKEVAISDAILDSTPHIELGCTSGKQASEEKTNTVSGTVVIIQDEDCSRNVSECMKSTAPDGIHTTRDVNAHDTTASESVVDVQWKDTEDSRETFASPGTFTQDAQADSNKQNDGAFVSGSDIADCEGHLEAAELDARHKDTNHSNEESKRTTIEDTCKSCSAGTQCDDPTNSVGRIGFAVDGVRDSVVSQDNHVHMVDGDDLTGFQGGYDSPYEDGELRGSFLCSWEDNEMENECVDYESDGRNGDGSDAADYPGSEIVEGGSEGSHGTRRSLSSKISPDGKSKNGPVKHSMREHFVKDDSDNNEIAGKGSNAGSGTTVEQCMEMVMEENEDMKRRQLIVRRDGVDVKVRHVDEYASKTVRGKLQSRIEGRSSLDATDGKDDFFMQQCRSRRLDGSYSRPERDISPDRYLGRYRSVAQGDRDGVHQWTSLGSRRRYTSNYQGAEGRNHTRPRSRTGESADKIDGVDFHDLRQTANYLSKGLHRPLIRRSPVGRDDYFGVGRRIPLRRGLSNYRSRGHYSQRAGRDFVEDLEPLPDDTGASVRMPRYLSRRERSFSPTAGRSAHLTIPRRRSRSRSRTRSPRAWHSHSHRERIFGTRRHSRSPEFRSEARMERMRLPFSKPTFASDYGEGYISPSRGRFSPQQNCRWVDDRNFADNHIRRRRSPVRVFRRTQRFEAVGSSGRLKSDEYFRPGIRPGRFSFIATGGRECKLESNYDDRRRDDSGEMMHRVVHSGDAGNIRRFRHNAADDFETNNLNNEDVRVTNPRDVPQTQCDREDKRAFKI